MLIARSLVLLYCCVDPAHSDILRRVVEVFGGGRRKKNLLSLVFGFCAGGSVQEAGRPRCNPVVCLLTEQQGGQAGRG